MLASVVEQRNTSAMNCILAQIATVGNSCIANRGDYTKYVDREGRHADCVYEGVSEHFTHRMRINAARHVTIDTCAVHQSLT